MQALPYYITCCEVVLSREDIIGNRVTPADELHVNSLRDGHFVQTLRRVCMRVCRRISDGEGPKVREALKAKIPVDALPDDGRSHTYSGPPIRACIRDTAACPGESMLITVTNWGALQSYLDRRRVITTLKSRSVQRGASRELPKKVPVSPRKHPISMIQPPLDMHPLHKQRATG